MNVQKIVCRENQQFERICGILSCSTFPYHTIETPNLDEISKSISKKKYQHYEDIQILIYFLNKCIKGVSDQNEQYGIPFCGDFESLLNAEMSTISGRNTEISTRSVKSNNLPIVIKKFNDNITIKDIIRVYFIGIMALNGLRKHIPNFVCTLGAYRNQLSTNIIYENINGKTVSALLRDNLITFEQYLTILVQLACALEFAQQKIGFTHFDLHTANVMVKNTYKYKYNISLDEFTYEFIVHKLPVIIDYDIASITVADYSYGDNKYHEHGITSHIIPGYDIYKFLIYSIPHTNPELQQKIIRLFSFYGDNDPYKIYEKGVGGVWDALSNSKNISKAIFSNAAKYTPMMFIQWILKRYNLKEFINVVPRYEKEVKSKYSDLVPKSPKALKIPDNRWQDIKQPSQKQIDTDYKNIMKLDYPLTNRMEANTVLVSFLKTIDFCYKLNPCLLTLYSERECMEEFYNSNLYIFYKSNITKINQGVRWAETIFSSIKIY